MTEKEVFYTYDSILNNDLKGYGVLNYMTSHDDGQPFDNRREMPYKTATMLLLTPGASQIYYGDESARNLIIDGAVGDARHRGASVCPAVCSRSAARPLTRALPVDGVEFESVSVTGGLLACCGGRG